MHQSISHESAKRLHRPVQVELFTASASEPYAPQVRAAEGEESVAWTDEEVFFLHVRLLRELKHLAEPGYPLADKFELLRWVFTDKDDEPFSFANCLRLCSGFRFTEHIADASLGQISVHTVREQLRAEIATWWRSMLEVLPQHAAKIIREHPDRSEEMFLRNKQFLNEHLLARRLSRTEDFFDAVTEVLTTREQVSQTDVNPRCGLNGNAWLDIGQPEGLDTRDALRHELAERNAAARDDRKDRRLETRLAQIVVSQDWEAANDQD